MIEQLGQVGNPSSLHAAGRSARRVVEESRELIASELGALPGEVIFTGGGTESNNLAVKGLWWARRASNPQRRRVLVSAVEHPSVLAAARWLGEYENAAVELVPVDSAGRLDLDALQGSVLAEPDSVALVSVMWANNEVGTVQPVPEVVEIAHAHGIPVHTDAVQAAGAVPVSFAGCGADAMTITSHKVGGPFGIGVLLARRGLALTPVLHGGGQERDVRSGTLDAPAAAGFAAALAAAMQEQLEHEVRLRRLRSRLVKQVQHAVPDAVRNGHLGRTDEASTSAGDTTCRDLPGVAHFSFPGTDADSLLLMLDRLGVQCSTGSACAAGVTEISHVLLAMGVDPATAGGSLRFSLGHTSTDADIDAVGAAIGEVVARGRAAVLVGG